MANSEAEALDADRRRKALLAFMEKHQLKAKPWAEKAGLSNANVIYNFLNRRSASLNQRTLKKLAIAAGAKIHEITGEEFLIDTLPPSLRATAIDMGPTDLPVYGRALGTDGAVVISPEQEPITHVPRPPELVGVREAFAVFAAGNSMFPMYKAGQILYARPDFTLRPGAGILIEKVSDEAIMKEYVRQASDGFVVKEYRPQEREFLVPFSDVRRAVRLFGAVDE